MKKSQLSRSTGWRRRVLATGFGLGAALAVAAVAWACTLRVGTLIVCSNPPFASTVVPSTSNTCSRVTGTGGQAGMARVDPSGSHLAVAAVGFMADDYTITFRHPGSTSGCHRASATVIQLAEVGTGKTLFAGPDFATVVQSPASSTGTALVCVQDDPNVVTGNQVTLAVI